MFKIGIWTTTRENLQKIFIEATEVKISDDLQSVIADGKEVLKVEEGTEIAFISKPPYEENEDYFYQSEMFSW